MNKSILIIAVALLSLGLNAQEPEKYNRCAVYESDSIIELNEGEWEITFYQDSITIDNLDNGSSLLLKILHKENQEEDTLYRVDTYGWESNLMRGKETVRYTKQYGLITLLLYNED